VPEPGNPQSLNRYTYGYNNPVKYTDPTGHAVLEDYEGSRVVNPITGRLMRIRTPQLDWSGLTPQARAMAEYIHSEMTGSAQGNTVAFLGQLNASGDGGFALAALGIFGWKVRQNGEWDPKPKLQAEFYAKYENQVFRTQFSEGDGTRYYYDAWGNIMFGYLGNASGFPESILQEGAGIEQIGSSFGYTVQYLDFSYLPRPASGSSPFSPRSWDDPADQLGSQVG
jgi:hypothetical protein